MDGIIERIRCWYGNFRRYKCSIHDPDSLVCRIKTEVDRHKDGCGAKPCRIYWPGSPGYKKRMEAFYKLREDAGDPYYTDGKNRVI